MATTTNYGWTTPDDTALVKDGAAAIRTLGSSVDTTTKNLNPSTTLGDIEYRSSTANTNTRLGIGSTGQVLTVSGGVPSWATSAAGGMTLISTTTLTGASVVISSIPATYNNLQLVIRGAKPATDGAALYMRLNGDTSSNYFYHLNNRSNNVAVSSSLIVLVESADNAVNTSSITLDFYDYANTTTWKNGWGMAMVNDSTTPANINYQLTGYAYNQTAAISSVTLYPSTGNWTSGTAYLYGIK